MKPAPQAGLFDPEPAVAYPSVLRVPGNDALRAVVGVGMVIMIYVLVVGMIIPPVIVGIGFAVTHPALDWAAYYRSAMKLERPIGMVASNLAIATMIPVTIAAVAYWNHLRPRWLMSVQPGLRWRYLILCLGTSLVGFCAVLAVSFAVEGWPRFAPQPGLWGFVAVIVVTSPLQAAAEEFLFRGYLLTALCSVVHNPWFGVGVSALVFAAFHGAQSPALFANRLAFGVLAGVLAWRTGGLEAGIAAHVANNLLSWLLAGTTSSIAAVMATRQVTWGAAGFDIAGFVVVAALAWLVGRGLNVAVVTPAHGLAPRPRIG